MEVSRVMVRETRVVGFDALLQNLRDTNEQRMPRAKVVKARTQ